MSKNKSESVKWINYQYLLAIIYLGLIIFIGFSTFRIGLSHFLILLAKEQNSNNFAQKAIDVDTSSPDAYNIRGTLFLYHENYQKALENFEKVAEFRKNDYAVWMNIGLSRSKLGDFNGAQEAYQKSLQFAPYYSQLNRDMGMLLLENNQIEKGFEFLSKSAESNLEIYPELLELAQKQYPNNPTQIEKLVLSKDVRSKILLGKFLIGHRMMTENLHSFLIGEELSENEKNEFIRYLILNKDFNVAKEVWASLNKNKTNLADQEKTLIFDGGFENLSENEEVGFGWQIIPKNQSLAVLIDDKIRHSGNQSIKIKFGGQSKTNSKLISQLIAVKPNQNYRLTFNYNSSNLVTGGLPIILVNDAVSNKSIGQSKEISSTNGQWIQQTVDFQTNENSAINVSLQRMNCKEAVCPIIGEMWVDDFSIKEL